MFCDAGTTPHHSCRLINLVRVGMLRSAVQDPNAFKRYLEVEEL